MFRVLDGLIPYEIATEKMDLYLVKDCGEIYWALSRKHVNCQTQLLGPNIKFLASVKTITGEETPCDDIYCDMCHSKRRNPHHF